MEEIEKDLFTLFISYSWNDKELVDVIDKALIEHGITAKRDVRDIEYRQSIKDFMSKIRETDFSMIVLSDSYLKSFNCMFEILEFIKDPNYKERIVPIFLKSAYSIFTNTGKMDYIKYWEDRLEEEKNQLNYINPQNTISIIENINKIENVCRNIGEFLHEVTNIKSDFVDMNNYKDAINGIINRILQNLTKIVAKKTKIVAKNIVNYIEDNEILVYHTVLIYNEKTGLYNGYIPDLTMYAEGDTKEEVASCLIELMQYYFELAKKYKTDIPTPSHYDDVKKQWIRYQIFSIAIHFSTNKSFYADPFGIIK